LGLTFKQVLVDEPDLADGGDTKALENGADSDMDDGMDRMVYRISSCICLGFVNQRTQLNLVTHPTGFQLQFLLREVPG